MTPITLGPLVLAGGLATPLLTAVFTKLKASSTVKAFMTFALSAGFGAWQATISAPHTGVTTNRLVASALVTWFVAIVSHYGFWKPAAVTDALQAATENFGVGPGSTPATVGLLTAGPAPEMSDLAHLATRLGLESPVEITPGTVAAMQPTVTA